MFLEDDNIQILEIPEKNSGRAAGAFLSKRKLQNPDGSLTINPQDLYAGARVLINGFTFEIYHAAKKTLKYMEQHTDIWSYSDMDKISKKLLLIADEIKAIFVNSNNDNDRFLTVESLKLLLDNLSNNSSVQYTRQEVITLIRYLTDAGNSTEENDVVETITETQLMNYLDSL
jgi:hypothetical protein